MCQGLLTGVLGQRLAGGVILLDQLGGLTDPVGHDLEHAAVQLLGYLLGQARNPHALGQHPLTVVGLEVAGDQFQQRRLALAVAAEQADALARLDRQVDAVDQRRVAVAQ